MVIGIGAMFPGDAEFLGPILDLVIFMHVYLAAAGRAFFFRSSIGFLQMQSAVPPWGFWGIRNESRRPCLQSRSAKTIQHLSSRSVCQRAKRLRAIGSLLNSWRICRGSQPGTTPRPFDLNPQVLRSCVMLDRDLVLDVIEDAQRIWPHISSRALIVVPRPPSPCLCVCWID